MADQLATPAASPSGGSPPALRVEGLRNTYEDGFTAVAGHDLEIPDGAFFGLLGPNGAGKTTLIGSVCNIVRPSAGALSVFGHDHRSRQARRLLDLAAQEINVDRFLSIPQILIYHAGYHGIGRKAAARRADEPLALFRLDDKADVRAYELSGGTQRRLVLARAQSPRIALQRGLLLLPGAESQDYAEQIDDILALLAGTYRSPEGVEAHVVPGEGADVEVWIRGSSGGQSAAVAGRNGLRFAANYHVSPATVLEAVEGYRSFFQPSEFLDKPYVSVSADVVVAEDDATARALATGYGPWVRSIRTAEGAIEYPTPEEARAHPWTDEDQALVQDRLDTQFVGSPGRVADQLEQLQEATGADELLITTITHDHTDRVRSYELLAAEWRRRGHSFQPS
ncbi:LLM class flavin-dependent oxidoreductase [Streptomyces sp. NPDC003996]